ncbi:MAG: ABC transporter substrate-binding protein [Eggerthellaceae bacterium]|nr:ABC transporter substrate-binding protein [Eggerthellaceae bacterium]
MKAASRAMRKRIGILLLTLCVATMLAVFVGCTSQSSSGSAASSTASASSSAASASASSSASAAFTPYTFKDALDREITIDAPIERVAIVQVPILSTYTAYMDGTTDKLVGVSKNIIGQMKDSIFAQKIDGFMKLSSDCFADGKLNVEELVKLKADVILIPNGNADMAKALENAGIKTVAVNVQGDSVTLYAEWLKMLETLFNEPGKMDACIAEGNKLVDQAKSVSSGVADKASVMVVYGYSNGMVQVAGNQSRTTFWSKYTNFENAAAEIQGINGASMEQIVAWDPQVILLPGTGQCNYLPTDLYNNSIEGADFSTLSAVQNHKVYCCGLGGWSWFTPSTDAPLVTLWLTKALYPEQSTSIDLKSITKSYYKTYYGIDLTDADMAVIYPDYAGI